MAAGQVGVAVVFLGLASGAFAGEPEFRGPRLEQSEEARLELAVGFLSRAISREDGAGLVSLTVVRSRLQSDSLAMAVEDLLGPLREDGLRLIPGLAVEDLEICVDSAVVECSARPIFVRQSDRTIMECAKTTETIVFVQQQDVWKMANEDWLLGWLSRIRDGLASER